MMGDWGGDLAEIFPGTSEMAQTMRRHDWTATSLGDPRDWPDALKIPLRMLLTSKFEMWLGWGDDLRFFYNDAYIPTLGAKHPSVLGQPFRDVWSEVYDAVADQVERVKAGESTWNNAMPLLLERNGYPEETHHSFSYSPLYAANGAVSGMLCVVSEETGRVIGERRLETLRQLGMALVGVADAAAVRAAAQSVFDANQQDFPFASLTFAGEDGDALHRALTPNGMNAACGEGRVVTLPTGVDWPKGAWDRPPTEAICISIAGPAGQAAAGSLIVGINPHRRDDHDMLDVVRLIAGQISGAMANVTTLRTERRRADRVWTFSRDLMVIVDAEGVFRSVSPSWTRLLGHPVDEVIGSHFADYMVPEDVASSTQALGQAIADGELTSYENRFMTADGGSRLIEWHTSMEDDLVYAYGRDITDRRAAEQALGESEEQFRHLVQGVTDYAIYRLDPEGRVSSWNEGARRIKGYEPQEIIGEHFSRFYTDEDRDAGEPARALETAREEGRFLAEGWRVRKNGERFRASVVIDAIRDDAGRPIGFAKITRDITEREQAQQELELAREALSQSQKMEAIGQLTGGVAHDFNNLLMAVLGSLELLGKRMPDDPLMQRLLANATEGAQRGATLTQRMLAFARRQDLKVDRIDVSQLLSGMGDLVQRSIGPEWPISINLPFGLPAARADTNQLEMALLNLIVNARDAMPSGGAIIVSATREDVARRSANLVPGRYVRLAVTDRGEGMSEETLRRATEPFFTTKGVGKGTGLGLPMVHGMAQQIGGAFELLSTAGEGTSAVLWLPVAEDVAADAAPATAVPPAPETRPLTILAVDDDPLVLMNTAALLEDLGHSVIEMDSAAAALRAFRARDDIDLMITDQAMPDMTGVELIGEIETLRAGLPTIVASGYGEGVEGLRSEIVKLSKPFNQDHLARAIALALDGG